MGKQHADQQDDSSKEQQQAELLESALQSLQQEQQPAPSHNPADNELVRFAGRMRGELAHTQEIDPAFSHRLFTQLESMLQLPEKAESATAASTLIPAATPAQKTQPTSSKPSRRAIITGGLAAAASFAVGYVSKTLADQTPQPQPQINWNTALVGLAGVWTPIGALKSMPPGTVTRFSTGQIVGHLVHRRDGTLLALSAACTHMGCLVHWNAQNTTFDCPCHDWQYTEEGVAPHNEAYRPLPTMSAKIENDIVYVFTPAALE